MGSTEFLFSAQQFNRLFPFYILINEEKVISSFGFSLGKLLQIETGQQFDSYFNVIRPKIKSLDFDSIKRFGNQVALITLKNDAKTVLRGQFEFNEVKSELMFVGTPWVSSIEEIRENKLEISDFAKHDSLIDQLNLLKAQELAKEDIKKLLQTSDEQKKALKYSEHLWKYALEGSGDGIWQYDVNNNDGPYFPPYKKALGYAIEDEFSFNEWRTAIHSDDLEKITQALDDYLQGNTGQFIVEHRLKHKDGHYKYFVARGIIVEWDNKGMPILVIGNITDIDAQKQLELRIKETANRLSYLIENLHSGVVVESKEGKIILINEKFCSIFGISALHENLTGGDFFKLLESAKELFKNPDDFLTSTYQLLERKQPVVHEVLEMKDGRFLERDYIPIFLDGNYEGHLWNYEDVTDKKVAEKKLKKQREFYENVLNNIPEDIAAFSPDREYLFINPKAIADDNLRKWMIGKKDEDYCERTGKSLTWAAERKEKFEKVRETKKLVFWEEKNININGVVEYQIRNLYPVTDDKNEIQQVIGFGVNISDRKRIEDQLRVNEKRYRDLFNYSQAYICTHDLRGKILTANPAICEKLGFPAEEIIGKNIVEFIPISDQKNFQKDYLERVVETGTAKGVFRVLGKTDKKSFLLYQNFKVEEEYSEPYIIGFSQDITERIWIEKELRKAKQITDESSKAKELFLANMSHEIRTPMSGILGIANMLSKTNLDETQKKYINLILVSANSLLTIVNDVLDIEKIASGKLELERIPFKLEEKVFTTVQSFQFKAEEKNVMLTFKSNVADDLIVLGDPSRLGQIFNNLISNALKFTKEGEIYVGICYSKNGYNSVIIEFEVRDTGIGIKPEKINDIFNPYVQASSDTSRKFGGTGLGLSICKELIEMQGGRITVESELNQGTVFTFYIPYDKGDASMLARDKEEMDFNSLADLKVLVAEDYELNQFLVQHILNEWGCKATMVNNGKEAVKMVEDHNYDLILMDIHMPEMDGITATKIIRAMKDNRKSSVPIIALTANALRGDHLNYMQAGINECVTKPYTEEKLYRMIIKIVKPNLKQNPIKSEDPVAPVKQVDTFIEQSNRLYDLSFINEFAKGDSSFTKKMVTIFVDTTKTEIERLITLAGENKYEQMSKVAHKMKSAIDGLGIASLKQPIRDLETLDFAGGGNGNPMEIINNIKKILDETFQQLSEVIYIETPKQG